MGNYLDAWKKLRPNSPVLQAAADAVAAVQGALGADMKRVTEQITQGVLGQTPQGQKPEALPLPTEKPRNEDRTSPRRYPTTSKEGINAIFKVVDEKGTPKDKEIATALRNYYVNNGVNYLAIGLGLNSEEEAERLRTTYNVEMPLYEKVIPNAPKKIELDNTGVYYNENLDNSFAALKPVADKIEGLAKEMKTKDREFISLQQEYAVAPSKALEEKIRQVVGECLALQKEYDALYPEYESLFKKYQTDLAAFNDYFTTDNIDMMLDASAAERGDLSRDPAWRQAVIGAWENRYDSTAFDYQKVVDGFSANHMALKNNEYTLRQDRKTAQYIAYMNLANETDFEKYSTLPTEKTDFAASVDNADSEYDEANMTHEEKAVYNYIYHKQGKEAADEYYDFLEKFALRARRGHEKAEKIQRRGWLGETAGSLGVNLWSGVEGFFTNIPALFTGEESTPTASQVAAAEIQQEAGEVGKWVYGGVQTVGNMLPTIAISIATQGAASWLGASSKAASAAGKIAGAASMGLSSAGNAVNQALAEGWRKDEAITYGVLVGSSESLLQYLIGGIGALGGISDDALMALTRGIDNSFVRVAASGLVKLSGEILEEEIQLFVEPWIASVVTGMDYNTPAGRDMLDTLVMTAISTSLLSSGDVAGVEIDYKKFGELILRQHTAAELLNEARQFESTSSAYKIANRLTSETASVSDIGRLYAQMSAEGWVDPKIAQQQAQTNKGSGEETKNTIPADGAAQYDIVAMENGNVFVKASRNVITGKTTAEQRKNITEFFNTLLEGEPSIEIETIEGDILTITKADTADKARDNYKQINGMPVKMSDDEFAVKLRVESHIDEVAEVSKRGKEAKTSDTKGHAFAKDGFTYRTAYFEDVDGQYYKVTLSVGNNGTTATIYNVGKIEGSVPPSAKVLAVVGSKALGGTLPTNSIPEAAQNSNTNFAEADPSQSPAATALPGESQEPAVQQREKVPGLWGYKGVDPKRWHEYDRAKRICDALGIEMRVEDLGENTHGRYHNGVVTLSSNTQRPAVRVLIHELTHHLERSGLYNRLSSAVMDYANKTFGPEAVNAIKQGIAKEYAGKNLDEAGINKEFVAKYAEDFLFRNEAAIEELCRKDRNLGETILRWLQETLAKITGRDSTMTEEERFLRDAEALYRKALHKAGTTADVAKDPAAQAQNLYAGVNANTADFTVLSRAREMEQQGVDAEAIRQETGWKRGDDGKWRFEIDDSEMRLKDVSGRYTTLGRMIDHPKLFENYPALEHISVSFEKLEPGTRGQYDRSLDEIYLSEDLRENEEELLDVLTHEIQHVIQKWEGFANGSNPQYWQKKLDGGMDSRKPEQLREEKQLYDEFNRIREEEPEFFDAMMELESMKPTVPRGKVNWATLEQLEEDPPEWQQFDARRDVIAEQFGDTKVFDFLNLRHKMKLADEAAGRDAFELYRQTAGEGEGRDAASRRTMTAEERKNTPPKLLGEDAVFANSEKVKAMAETDLTEVIPATREEAKNMEASDQRNVARFRAEVDAVLAGNLPTTQFVLFGKPSNILQKYMKSDKMLYMPQKAIKKGALDRTDGGKHNLGKGVIYDLPYQFADPLAITGNTTAHEQKGENGIVVWTDWVTRDGDTVIVPIRIDAQGNMGPFNSANTIFDVFNQEYVQDLLRDGNVLYTRNGRNIHDLLAQQRQVLKRKTTDVSTGSIPDGDRAVKIKTPTESDSSGQNSMGSSFSELAERAGTPVAEGGRSEELTSEQVKRAGEIINEIVHAAREAEVSLSEYYEIVRNLDMNTVTHGQLLDIADVLETVAESVDDWNGEKKHSGLAQELRELAESTSESPLEEQQSFDDYLDALMNEAMEDTLSQSADADSSPQGASQETQNDGTLTEEEERARARDLDDYFDLVQRTAERIAPSTPPMDGSELVSTKTEKEKKSLGKKLRESWNYFKRKMVDSGTTVADIGKKVGDRHLYHYYNMARGSSNAAIYMITNGRTDINGKVTGKSLNDILSPIRKKGDDYYNRFQLYLFHKHNVDRMSRAKPGDVDAAREAFSEFRKAHPELNGFTENEIQRMAQDDSSPYFFEAEAFMMLRDAVLQAQGKRNLPVFGEGHTAESSRDTADRLLQENPEFAELAKEVYAYTDNLMQYRVDSGLITEADRQLLKSIYPHYVPTYRVEYHAKEKGGKRKIKGVEIGSTVGRAEGGNTKLVPLHTALAKQTMNVVREGSKNRFGQRLMEKGRKTEYIKNVEEAENIFHENTFDDPEQDILQKANTFTVREGGKRYEMEVTPELFEAVKALSPDSEEANVATKLVRKGNDLFKKLVTGYNPLFMVRNFFRDLQDAAFYSKDLSAFAKTYPKAWKEIATNGEYWQRYQALGGTFSSVFDYDTGDVTEGNWVKRNVVGRIEFFNQAVEQAPRLAEFMATLDKHGGLGADMDTVMEAMYNAADITVNFGRSGTLGKALNANYIPFLNPSIQGFDKMIRNVTETKGAKNWFRLIGKAALFGFAPAIINGLLYDDDDEWEDLKKSDKDTNYLFKIRDGLWLKIPKGRTLSLLGMTADRAKDAVQGKEIDWGGFIQTAAAQTAPANPLEQNILKAWFDADLTDPSSPGKTWYGGDIENQRLQGYEPGQRYDAKTDVVSKWLGGKLNISPKKINYLLDQYSGVVGDVLLPLLTPTAERDMFTAGFTVDSTASNRLSQDFYSKLDELTFKKNAPNATGTDAVMYRFWNKQGSAISEINKGIRAIEEDETLSDKEKRDLLHAQYAIRNGIIKTAEGNYDAYAESVAKHYAKTTGTKEDKEDHAYLMANWEVLGAEYALLNYSKSAYEKAAELNGEGISYDDSLDMYLKFRAADDMPKEEAYQRERNIIIRSGLTEEQKILAYESFVSDKKGDEIAAFQSAGLSFDDYLSYEAAVYGLGSDDTSTKKEKVMGVIDGMDISDKQKDAIYIAAGYSERTIGEAPWKSNKALPLPAPGKASEKPAPTKQTESAPAKPKALPLPAPKAPTLKAPELKAPKLPALALPK